jgi:hypothetical protein
MKYHHFKVMAVQERTYGFFRLLACHAVMICCDAHPLSRSPKSLWHPFV